MSEFPTVYSAGWVDEGQPIPEMSRLAMGREDRAARREVEEAAQRAEDAADAAETAARIEGRDTSLDAVWERAQRSMRRTDHQAEKEGLAAKAASGEVEILDGTVIGRSEGLYPATDYEADVLIARAEDNHRWLVAYQARRASREGRAAEHVAVVRSARAPRDQPTSTLTSYSELTR